MFKFNVTSNSPCYQCTDRKANCHTDCGKYQHWKKEEFYKRSRTNKQINPPFCRYFKERSPAISARQSKKRRG